MLELTAATYRQPGSGVEIIIYCAKERHREGGEGREGDIEREESDNYGLRVNAAE